MRESPTPHVRPASAAKKAYFQTVLMAEVVEIKEAAGEVRARTGGPDSKTAD
jgi:hypothetical protein